MEEAAVARGALFRMPRGHPLAGRSIPGESGNELNMCADRCAHPRISMLYAKTPRGVNGKAPARRIEETLLFPVNARDSSTVLLLLGRRDQIGSARVRRARLENWVFPHAAIRWGTVL